MKLPILLMVCVLGAAHGLPTFRQFYDSAKSAIGFKSPETVTEYVEDTSGVPLRVPEEETTTSKYSLRAVVNKAKSYIPSASSLVPKLSYQDGTLSYSWGFFHMSGGVHRPTTPAPQTTKSVPEITEQVFKVESRTISNYIPRTTSEPTESSQEEINTGVLRSTEEYEEEQPRGIYWNPRYEEEYPPLPPTENSMEARDDAVLESGILPR